MSIEVKVPQLPESVADATLVAWHKGAGEAVQRDENLVDLETDKVVLEVPAPSSGVLKEIRIPDGTTVSSGEVLAILGAGDGEPASVAPAVAAAVPAGKDTGATPKTSPAVRRLLEEHELDPGAIRGSGKDGRITKADVLEHLAKADEPAAADPAPVAAPSPPAALRGDRRVPMTRLRSRIAERMVQAQHTAAMLTTFNEIDLGAVKAMRAAHKDAFLGEHGVKLGFMSFFVKASVEALKRFPAVNASIEDNDVVYHDYFDIGIAVSTERGLVVPVLRDADTLGFAQIEKAIGDFGARARDGAITMEDLTGGTFTITNGGVFGSLMSTPILNPPQSGILGMHKIQDRPMVVDGEVRVRPMMYIALTYDHRIIDGREAVQFLVSIKQSLEDPHRLLLQL